MLYLSKGSALPSKQGGLLQVSRCGKIYALGTQLGALWRGGRLTPQSVPAGQERAVARLEASGLVSTTEEAGALGAYRLVISCVLCPSYKAALRLPLCGRDRRVWDWITQAGLRLTASELVRLEERQILPMAELLGEDGRQLLTETIYTEDNIADGILETQMEHSTARDDTVSSILKLLQSRRLLLV